MRLPRVRFTVWRLVAVSFLAGAAAVAVAWERREHLKAGVTADAARVAYSDARHAREDAETALKRYVDDTYPRYVDDTYPRELASVEAEIRQAESRLGPAKDEAAWVDRVRSKGYLLLIRDEASRRMALQRAIFEVERAKNKRAELEQKAKRRDLRELEAQVELACATERTKRAASDRARTAKSGWFGRLLGGR